MLIADSRGCCRGEPGMLNPISIAICRWTGIRRRAWTGSSPRLNNSWRNAARSGNDLDNINNLQKESYEFNETDFDNPGLPVDLCAVRRRAGTSVGQALAGHDL